MKISNRFILLVFFAHALIIIGFGHAIAFLGMTILFSFDFIRQIWSGQAEFAGENIIEIVGALCTMGYMTLLTTIYLGQQPRRVCYFFSIAVLSSGILILYFLDSSMVFYMPVIFAIPFFIIALLSLYRPLLLRWWRWAMN